MKPLLTYTTIWICIQIVSITVELFGVWTLRTEFALCLRVPCRLWCHWTVGYFCTQWRWDYLMNILDNILRPSQIEQFSNMRVICVRLVLIVGNVTSTITTTARATSQEQGLPFGMYANKYTRAALPTLRFFFHNIQTISRIVYQNPKIENNIARRLIRLSVQII